MSGRTGRARRPAALRALGWFWLALVLMLGGGAVALTVFGPPRAMTARGGTAPAGATVGARTPARPATTRVAAAGPKARPTPAGEPGEAKPLHATAAPVHAAADGAATPASTEAPASSTPAGGTSAATTPTSAPAGAVAVAAAPAADRRIAEPDPLLLEASGVNGAEVPRIGADGRMPMQVYAGAFDRADRRPRIAIVLDGAGLSAAYTRDAIESLPAAVSLAFSPYAVDPGRLLEAARAKGHEILVSIPLEPQGYPLNDPGSRALLTEADPAINQQNLFWALSKVPGAAGATGALDGLLGERYAASAPDYDALQSELARRGLYYLDPRPGRHTPDHVIGSGVDLLLDVPPTREGIDTQLAKLEQIARERGSAVGLGGPLRPVTVESIAAWSEGAASRGIVLAPVSAVLPPLAKQAAAAAEKP